MTVNTLKLANCQRSGSRINSASQPPSILVIEDDLDNLVLLYHFLKLSHFDVFLASDALTGLKLAAAHPPDLILLDIKMPKISGYEVIRRLRQNLKLVAIPVIAVTGMSTDTDQQDILQAGCADYICKPYLLDQLQAAIQRQLTGIVPKVAVA